MFQKGSLIIFQTVLNLSRLDHACSQVLTLQAWLNSGVYIRISHDFSFQAWTLLLIRERRGGSSGLTATLTDSAHDLGVMTSWCNSSVSKLRLGGRWEAHGRAMFGSIISGAEGILLFSSVNIEFLVSHFTLNRIQRIHHRSDLNFSSDFLVAIGCRLAAIQDKITSLL